jgi:hypothetical protein
VLGRERGAFGVDPINSAKKKLGIRSDKAQMGAPWWWLLKGQEIPTSPTTLMRNVGNVGIVAESPTPAQ